jgi:ribulose-phosphate 3-epimerase
VRTALCLIAHILAYDPLQYVESLKQAGFAKAIFHLEAADHPDSVIRLARKLDMEVGLAINPATAGRELEAFAERVDEFLFLAVDPQRPGLFRPEVLQKISASRRFTGEAALLSIDGAVDVSNIVAVKQSGVDVAYAGHAIFGAGEPGENYRRMARAVG